MSETEAKFTRMSPAERWDMAMASAREAYLQLQIMQGAVGGSPLHGYPASSFAEALQGSVNGSFTEALRDYMSAAETLVEVLGTMLVEGQLDDVRDIIDVAYAGRG